LDESQRYQRASVTLLALIAEKQGAGKAEILMYRAGLGIKEISELVGKNYLAVAKTISRARLSQRKTSHE
jgi:hypothetical protein